MNKREQQRNDRRNQILNCSLDMIISRGYAATTIRDIAKELKISTGLFFNYFESKEQVYEELVKCGMSGPQHVSGILENNNVSPIESFELITAEIFKSLQTDSMTAKMFILMPQAMNSAGVPENIKQIASKFDAMSPVLPVIENGQKLGQIKQGSSTALAVAYWSAIQGIAENVVLNPGLPMPESSWIVDILRA
ncbi:MAG TPA: TetR/AcrR family transcriptional regulator [Ruminiclostridium sp.]|nr:TetR/AcrR family transcriptional regulator [Ruminiclostridium sp.]